MVYSLYIYIYMYVCMYVCMYIVYIYIYITIGALVLYMGRDTIHSYNPLTWENHGKMIQPLNVSCLRKNMGS